MSRGNAVIAFGKHRGTRWEDLPSGYLEYLRDWQGIRADTLELVEAELRRRFLDVREEPATEENPSPEEPPPKDHPRQWLRQQRRERDTSPEARFREELLFVRTELLSMRTDLAKMMAAVTSVQQQVQFIATKLAGSS